MPRRGPWMGDKLAEQNLGDKMLRHGEQILVGCSALCGPGHEAPHWVYAQPAYL
jgi:hypothetical protein